MARDFRVTLYTPQDLAQQETAQVVWELVNDPRVGPQRFGATERTQFDFDESAHHAAGDVYRDDGVLFVRGNRDNFMAMFDRQPGGWARWNFWWAAKAMARRRYTTHYETVPGLARTLGS